MKDHLEKNHGKLDNDTGMSELHGKAKRPTSISREGITGAGCECEYCKVTGTWWSSSQDWKMGTDRSELLKIKKNIVKGDGMLIYLMQQ